MVQSENFKKETNYDIDALEINFGMMNTLITTTFEESSDELKEKYLSLGGLIQAELCETNDKTDIHRKPFFPVLGELITRYYLLTKDYSKHLKTSLYCLNRVVGRTIKPEEFFHLQSSYLGSYVTRNHYFSDGTFNFTTPWAVVQFDRSAFSEIHRKFEYEVDISIISFENPTHFNASTIVNSSFVQYNMFTAKEQSPVDAPLSSPLSIQFKPKNGEFDVASAQGFLSNDKYICRKFVDDQWTESPNVYIDAIDKSAIVCKTSTPGLYQVSKVPKSFWDKYAYIVYGVIVIVVILLVIMVMCILCIGAILLKRLSKKRDPARIRLPEGEM
eukprot:CAMPEP_0117429814 /NCGR_PEP_ID=MMETSP0758-20121206/9346_1 /TAXON_ID=63605 /ORGANISM="Percolomonas cosmopolitus, Strain AE-1 (ATCC 50343)" /LENGTH=329 /DNA_ID=CAMNT_0005217195 /DNA_START=526 /DNA_END=1512 /DNA_ORIENTATION=+